MAGRGGRNRPVADSVRLGAYGNAANAWNAAIPTPGTFGRLAGDLTEDGVVDVQDIDRLSIAIQAGDPAFDLDGDSVTDLKDLRYLVQEVLGTSVGDADLDGSFDSLDFVAVFQLGEFNDAIPGNSTWSEGDWNCDGDFNSDDILFVMQWGSYEVPIVPLGGNPLAAVAAARDVSDPLSVSSEATESHVDAVDLSDDSAIQPSTAEWASRESLFQEHERELSPQEVSVEDAAEMLLEGLGCLEAASKTGRAKVTSRGENGGRPGGSQCEPRCLRIPPVCVLAASPRLGFRAQGRWACARDASCCAHPTAASLAVGCTGLPSCMGLGSECTYSLASSCIHDRACGKINR